jgi:outer membrane protein assembly factor BamB
MARPPRPSIVVAFLGGLGLVLALAAFPGAVPTGEGVRGEAAAAPPTVEVTVRVVDGDAALAGGGAMGGIVVSVGDASGAVVAQAKSGDDGLCIIPSVPAGSRLTISASAPRGHVTFPVEHMTGDVSTGDVVQVSLYRDDRQWFSWGRTNDHRRIGPSAGKPKGAALWRIDPGNNMEFPPSLAYGLVVYGSYHGFLCANDQKTGAIVWKAYPGHVYGRYSKFANQVAIGSWVENGRRVARVFYADLTGIVGCRDLFTGDVVWERTSGRGNGTGGKTLLFRSVESSPLVQGEILYICSRYDTGGSKAGVWAIDRRTGVVKWFRRLATRATSKIGSSPACSSGRLFAATYDGTVYALNASSGKVLWRRHVGGQFYSTPTVSGTRLYIGNKSNGRVYCLSARTGAVLWATARLGTSAHGSAAICDGRVYIGAGKHFFALNGRNGRVIWRRATSKRILGSPSVLRGVVYYSDLGTTYGRSARSGSLVWRKSAGRYSPITATRHLVVFCGKQSMYGYLPSK